jgi:hypothetical protein
MTASRDPDRLIRAFIREGEDELEDQVYDAVRAAIEQKRQRAFIGPWRTPAMNKIVTLGLGAAAVVVALVVGIQLFGSPGGFGGPGDEPSPTPHASAADPTVEPSVAEPTSSAAGILPEGPILVYDPPTDGAPSITMTISTSGWTHLADIGALEKGESVANVPEAVVLPDALPAGTGLYVYGDPCQWASTMPDSPATTVDEIVAALAAQASRNASEPVDVTVGGYAGKMITLHVPDDAVFSECEAGEQGPEFGTYQLEAVQDRPSRYHQGPGQIDDLWIVDVEGSIVIIDAMYRSDTPLETVEEMRALVESATFELP